MFVLTPKSRPVTILRSKILRTVVVVASVATIIAKSESRGSTEMPGNVTAS